MRALKSLGLALLVGVTFTSHALAQDMLSNTGDAAGDWFSASGRLVVSGVKVVFGVVALPVIAVGTIIEGAGHIVKDGGQAVYDDSNEALPDYNQHYGRERTRKADGSPMRPPHKDKE